MGSPPQSGFHISNVINLEIHIMSIRMPPVPPANRSKEPGSILKTSKDNSIKQDEKHEKHHNSAEEGDTANIKQNKTNKGFFRGRREG
jgi:hypothetical protein